MRFRNVESAQQAAQVLDIRAVLGRKGRFPVTANIIADNPELAGKFFELVIPHATVHLSAMDEYNRWAAPGLLTIQSRLGDGGRTALRGRGRCGTARLCRSRDACDAKSQQAQWPGS